MFSFRHFPSCYEKLLRFPSRCFPTFPFAIFLFVVFLFDVFHQTHIFNVCCVRSQKKQIDKQIQKWKNDAKLQTKCCSDIGDVYVFYLLFSICFCCSFSLVSSSQPLMLPFLITHACILFRVHAIYMYLF